MKFEIYRENTVEPCWLVYVDDQVRDSFNTLVAAQLFVAQITYDAAMKGLAKRINQLDPVH